MRSEIYTVIKGIKAILCGNKFVAIRQKIEDVQKAKCQ
jgi:hypothetical protein